MKSFVVQKDDSGKNTDKSQKSNHRDSNYFQ